MKKIIANPKSKFPSRKIVKLLIFFISILIFFIFPFLFKFKLLSYYKLAIQALIIVLGFIGVIISIGKRKAKNLKSYLITIGTFIFVFGSLLILTDVRLKELQPIAFATARLELHLSPTKVDKSKMDAPQPLIGIDLMIKGDRIEHFMQIRDGISWGRKGLASELHLNYAMDNHSVGYGKTFDFIDDYDAIMFTLWMLPQSTKIIKGRCIFTFNSIVSREIKIPPQKTDFVGSIYYINPKKKKRFTAQR